MAPPRDEGTETDPAPPTAFATDSAQDRTSCARRTSARRRGRASWPRSVQSLKGAGPKLSAAAADMGLGSVGDVLLHVPHSYRDRARAAKARRAADRRGGDGRGGRALGSRRPTRRRGLVIVEATVADDSGPAKAVWFNQAWLVDRLTKGTRLLLLGKLDRSGFRVEAHEVLGAGGPGAWNPHDRDRARPSGIRAAARAAPSRMGLAGPAPRLLCDRAASGRAPRPPRPGVGGGRVDRRPFSREPRRGGGGQAAPRVRGALPTSGRARGAALRAPGFAPGDRAGRPGRAGGALARLAALRAHRRPAGGDRRHGRRPRPSGRCSAC